MEGWPPKTRASLLALYVADQVMATTMRSAATKGTRVNRLAVWDIVSGES